MSSAIELSAVKEIGAQCRLRPAGARQTCPAAGEGGSQRRRELAAVANNALEVRPAGRGDGLAGQRPLHRLEALFDVRLPALHPLEQHLAPLVHVDQAIDAQVAHRGLWAAPCGALLQQLRLSCVWGGAVGPAEGPIGALPPPPLPRGDGRRRRGTRGTRGSLRVRPDAGELVVQPPIKMLPIPMQRPYRVPGYY